MTTRTATVNRTPVDPFTGQPVGDPTVLTVEVLVAVDQVPTGGQTPSQDVADQLGEITEPEPGQPAERDDQLEGVTGVDEPARYDAGDRGNGPDSPSDHEDLPA